MINNLGNASILDIFVYDHLPSPSFIKAKVTFNVLEKNEIRKNKIKNIFIISF